MNKFSEIYYMEQIRKRNPNIFSRLYMDNKEKLLNFILMRTNGNIEIAEEILKDQ